MRRFGLAGALVALAFAYGCGEPPSGSIVELAYTPAHRANVEVDDYILTCAGNPLVCTQQYVGSHLEERAFEAQWNATLTRCGHDAKCKTEVLAITRDQYQTWAIGDYYPAVLTYHGQRARGR